MRTRYSNFPNNSIVTILRRQNRGRAPNIVEPGLRTIVAPMAERTMEELLRAPTEGYGEAIVLSEINADHFEIKTNLLQLVQANPFHSYERENPHAHTNSFKRITSTLRFRDVANDVIKLMMFPYSLKGNARLWYEKEPPNSILTWEDLVTKFVTKLKNEISRFTQKFKETFSEAWERFKEMLRACPHHEFTELTQVDIFYNGLNENDQDSLNAAARGNLLSKTTREALNIIENKSKVRYSRNKSNVSRMNTTSRESVSKTDERIDKLADQILTLVEIVSRKVVTPAPIKAVEEICVTCSRPHTCGFFQNQASTSGTLSSNTIPNSMGEMKAITTRSGVAYEGPLIHTNPSPKKLSLPELTPTRMTLELADRSITHPKGLAEDVFVKVGKFHFPTDFFVVDFEADPRVPLILGRSFLRIGQVLGFSNNSSGDNPTSSSDPILSSTTLSFTPFEGGDFILKEIDTFLQTPDEFTDLDDDFYDTEGDILYLEQLLNEDPSLTLPPKKNEDLKEVTKAKPSIEEPPELELKDLPSHLEYAYLEENNKLPMIISKGLKDVEKEALLKVLKYHK
ncbi:reverse transcriptase domain-containing protein [Tanacetum coccineum]